MSDAQAFLTAATELLGERGLTRDPELLEPWLTDWRGRFTGRALALASPASTAEVSGLMRLCARFGIPVVPQGGNSGMSGGATPDASGEAVLLSLRRMNAIRRLDPQAREITCEAGVILQTLHETAAAEGLRFPLTLGVVTAATLRLLPALADRAVLWAGLGSVQDARALLLHAESRAGSALEGFEVMPRHSLEAVLAHVRGSRSPLQGPHAWHALIELAADRESAAGLPALAQHLLESAFEAGLVEDATIAANETQAEQFWLLRDEIAPAERALGPAMQHDVSVPVARMADFVAAAVPEVERRFPDTTAVAFGHLGDGNVHFHVLAPRGSVRGAWEEADGKAISAFVHDLVTEWGGSISAEHGIGQLKRDELGRLGDPVQLAMMRGIKKALDPHGLLNPGKLVPPCA